MPNQVDRVYNYAPLGRVGVPGGKHLPTELQNNFITGLNQMPRKQNIQYMLLQEREENGKQSELN